ncbi:MAG TPA: glycoside hydrolase family 38 C-terminal domain-containing protein [Candidatus Kapabacteria bacterium]|nr:glycoside hydrolase family 38 C-terminal domain-containing protein [Candidatus Kapabacteria bacterium]
MNQPNTSHGDRLPTIHMIGNAHLDPAWMWTWDEGMEAFIATCRSALDRMEETPEFIFSCSSAAHYAWIEEAEPELFERIRERVREGRWNIVGGWWVQADCNIPSGEGFVRQALLGQRYFAERFGTIARVGYSPDAFGHTAGLPQLLARAGMSAYIFCRPDPTELQLPSPLLRWHSPDGSSLLAYRVPYHYNMYETTVPRKVSDLRHAYGNASNLAATGAPLRAFAREWMLFYGVGNHGGGPTREQIAAILEIAAIREIAPDADAPELLFSMPDRFFWSIERDPHGVEIPDWHGDLQFNAPGCYAAHSEIKRLNRLCEGALAAAERLSSVAALATGAPYPHARLADAWRCVCFNHFHDLLCGVAIREALEDAIAMYGEALTVARTAMRFAVQRLARCIDTTGSGQTLMIVNPHAWPLDDHVTFELWHDIDKSLWPQPVLLTVTDDDGAEIPCQTGFTSGKIGKDRVAATFRAQVPALGWRAYRVHYGRRQKAGGGPAIGAGDTVLENELLRVEIDPATGTIARMLHRPTGRELLAGAGMQVLAIEDESDSWGHGVSRFDHVAGMFQGEGARLVENGPTHATIRSLLRRGASWLQLDYRLYRGTGALSVAARLFLCEPRRIVKLAFTLAAPGAEMICEGAYGITVKPCDGIERPGGTWCAVRAADADGRPGLAIVNDSKHSYSAAADADASTATLMMTAARSAPYAMHDPHPHNEDEEVEYLDMGSQRFRFELHPVQGDSWQAHLSRRGAAIVLPPPAHFESAHDAGTPRLERQHQGIAVHPETVLATVLKRSEDGTGWVVRLYEASGAGAAASVQLHGRAFSLRLAPYEVATVMMREGEIVRTDLTELSASPLDG